MTVDNPRPLWHLLYMRDAFALDVVRDVPRCSPPVVSVVTTGLTPPVTGAEVERTWASAIVNPYAVEVLDAVGRLLLATPADVQDALRVWKNSRTDEIVAVGRDLRTSPSWQLQELILDVAGGDSADIRLLPVADDYFRVDGQLLTVGLGLYLDIAKFRTVLRDAGGRK